MCKEKTVISKKQFDEALEQQKGYCADCHAFVEASNKVPIQPWDDILNCIQCNNWNVMGVRQAHFDCYFTISSK